MKLTKAKVAIPDYINLQKRSAKMKIPTDITVDSTGLKVYGE